MLVELESKALILGFQFCSICLRIYFSRPVLYYFDHDSFVIQFEIRTCDASGIVLSQDHFCSLGSSVASYEFQDFFL